MKHEIVLPKTKGLSQAFVGTTTVPVNRAFIVYGLCIAIHNDINDPDLWVASEYNTGAKLSSYGAHHHWRYALTSALFAISHHGLSRVYQRITDLGVQIGLCNTGRIPAKHFHPSNAEGTGD